MKNNSKINESEIQGIELISVTIDYVIEAISDKELKTSKTHVFAKGSSETAKEFATPYDPIKSGKGKNVFRNTCTAMVLDSPSGLSFINKKQTHNDQCIGDSEMEKTSRKRTRTLVGNTKSSNSTVEAAIQPHRS